METVGGGAWQMEGGNCDSDTATASGYLCTVWEEFSFLQ